MASYRIFAINPGSTSTKVALFRGEECIFTQTVKHDAAKLEAFPEINDQLPYRREIILREVKAAGHSLEGMDAFVGRGGGFCTMTGGTYYINELMLEHARIGVAGQHPSNLGSQLAHEFAQKFGGKAFIVNGPTTDEFDDLARICGFSDIYRESIIHALNQKEVAIRFAATQGKRYEEMNLVIAHIGGGVSVTAHREGRMVDSNDILNGDGPMAPTRSGALPAAALLKMCFSGEHTQREIYDRITKRGGLVDHLGTSDGQEIEARIAGGDRYAALVYDAMIYQVGKNIGAYAAALMGRVDAVLLTGGLSHSERVVSTLRKMISFIAPVVAMPGEFEMEALAAGALRILTAQETAKTYTGVPVWNGFDDLRP